MSVSSRIRTLLNALDQAGLDASYSRHVRRGGTVAYNITVEHRQRSIGRGKYSSHMADITVTPQNIITLSTCLWEPQPYQESIQHDASNIMPDEATLSLWLNRWYELVTQIEAPKEATTMNLPPVHASTPVPTYVRSPRETRHADEGMSVYITSTPLDHLDIPAGTRGTVTEPLTYDMNDDEVSVELHSTIFDAHAVRNINVRHLVYVDNPSVEVLGYAPAHDESDNQSAPTELVPGETESN